MRAKGAILAAVLAGMCAVGVGMAQSQALLPGGVTADDYAAAGDAPDARLYADGTRAIRESRWSDALKIFDQVAKARGPHAAGALYWKAYAESKQGDSGKVMESCAKLREQFVGSTWIDDCGALEIETRAKNGQPAQPQAGDSDELKLLALASLLAKDPTRARAQIEGIVQGNSSEGLKEGALFILETAQPDAVYPEIVRISYLEGDVRIARESKNQESLKNVTWETAVMNLPLQPGDSLATGKDGRVEIEFEDDSTVYMAENSALNCEDMHTTSNVPHTELALVSGTVTLHLDSLMPGETFLLHTPTNQLLTRYPQKADMRVSSFLDGIAVTALTPGKVDVSGTAGLEAVAANKTFLFGEGRRMTAALPEQTADYSAFDEWVADRYAARATDTAAVMQEAGLQRPIPGLAQLKGKGAFYDCAPYGKCWEPTPKKSMVASGGGTGSGPSGGGMGASGAWLGMNEWFPCMPWAMGYYGYMAGSPMGLGMGIDPLYANAFDSYSWAVCHAGYWMPLNGRYAWVIGRRFHLHHQPPVHWVREGHTVAAVPIHPRDVKGQPPVNREHGFEAERGKGVIKLTQVKLDGARPVELLKQPPREFRNVEDPKLARTEAPRMEAHALKGMAGARAGMAHAGVPLTFNRQQGFVATRQVMHGGRTVAMSMPVGHSGAISGGHGGAPAGFGAVGGGYHGGGGAVGGGFSHGGGGVSMANSGAISVSSTAGSASSGPSSSGGSHK